MEGEHIRFPAQLCNNQQNKLAAIMTGNIKRHLMYRLNILGLTRLYKASIS